MGWNTADKAEALGITERYIQKLTKLGILPATNDPKKITLAYVRYKESQGGGKSDLIEERIRLTRIQADQKEWDLKVSQGEYLHLDSAMALWGQVIQGIRSRLLSIPSKLAPLVIGCNGLSEIKEVSEKMIHEVMTEIANPNLKKYAKVHRPDSTDLSHTKTTDKADHKRMGRQQKSSKPRKQR